MSRKLTPLFTKRCTGDHSLMRSAKTIYSEAIAIMPSQLIRLLIPATMVMLLVSACGNGRQDTRDDMRRRQVDTAYESMQGRYQAMMNRYKDHAGSLPEEMNRLYGQMQQMRQRMDSSHQMMMGRMGQDMKGRGRMEGDKGMGMDRDDKMGKDKKGMRQGKGMGMRGGMSPGMMGRRTGEWYSQMQSMHERMGQMHGEMGQESMAKMHRRMAEEYGTMRNNVPEGDEPAELSAEEEENVEAVMAKGRSLYSQNCASCHGSNGQGMGSAFPPLIDAKWVTAEKSVPIRILLHGMTDEIEVNGQTYQGNMPAFKARLSAAEMAATLNYLRAESEGDYPEIGQEDVVQIDEEYEGRERAWSGEDLKGK